MRQAPSVTSSKSLKRKTVRTITAELTQDTFTEKHRSILIRFQNSKILLTETRPEAPSQKLMKNCDKMAGEKISEFWMSVEEIIH